MLRVQDFAGDPMSQVLGPIHYLMWRKIALAHGWEGACVAAAETAWGETRVAELLAAAAAHRWAPPPGELAELIGEQAIHGWLQEAVNRVEVSLAATTAALLGGGDDAEAMLAGASRGHGGEAAAASQAGEGGPPLARLTSLLMGCYLDGMPCDQVSEVVEQTPSRLAVRRILEVHRPNWERGSAPVPTMVALQGAWSAGLAAGLDPRIAHTRELQPVAGMLACSDTFTLD